MADQITDNNNASPRDDWKSTLPGAKKTSDSKPVIPKAPNPKPSPIQKLPEGNPRPPKENKLFLKPLPVPPSPKSEDKYREAKLPTPPKAKPMPKAPRPGESPLKENIKPDTNLRKVRTYMDDMAIAQGTAPSEHHIDYSKASSDEVVNKFVKRTTPENDDPFSGDRVVSKLPKEPTSDQMPLAPMPGISKDVPRNEYNIRTPRGVYVNATPLDDIQEQKTRSRGTSIPPIRKTKAPNAPSAKSESLEEDNEKPKQKSGLSPIRTLRADVTDVIQDQNVTLASIAIKEDEKRRKEIANLEKQSRSKWLVIGVITLLILLSSTALVYTFFIREGEQEGEINTPAPLEVNSIIFTDSETFIDISQLGPEEFRNTLALESAKEIGLGQIKNIIMTLTVRNSDGEVIINEVASPRIAIETLGLFPGDKFVRLVTENYMLGIFSFKTKEQFLIFETNDYSSVFAQMLSWESRDAAEQLHLALKNRPLPNQIDGRWVDKVVENSDVRVFVDQSDIPYLYWSFIDASETLVITTDIETLKEVRSRFRTSTISR